MFSTCLTALSTWELVLDNSVHGEDNLEEKTREDADNDDGWPEIFYVFNWTWLTTSTWELVVFDTVDGEDNLEENTREIADMFDRMCHFGWIFLQLGCDMLLWWWLISKFFFILSTCLKINTHVLNVVRHVENIYKKLSCHTPSPLNITS